MKRMLHETTADEIATAAFYRDDKVGAIQYRERSVCQVDEQSQGSWYLIRTELGRDLTAMRHLARRRFGVFLPMKGLRRVFPGWLCAYVFDVEVNEARILDCPGVMGLLKVERNVLGKPVFMPLRLDFAFIRALAAEAWQGDIPAPKKKADKKAKRAKITHDRKKLSKLKKAMKKADRAGELSRAVDIRAQITALRQKFSAPRGVAA